MRPAPKLTHTHTHTHTCKLRTEGRSGDDRTWTEQAVLPVHWWSRHGWGRWASVWSELCSAGRRGPPEPDDWEMCSAAESERTLPHTQSTQHTRCYHKHNENRGKSKEICVFQTLMRTISSGMLIMALVSQFSRLLAKLRMAWVKAPTGRERQKESK